MASKGSSIDKWDMILSVSFLAGIGFLYWSFLGDETPLKKVMQVIATSFVGVPIFIIASKKIVEKAVK